MTLHRCALFAFFVLSPRRWLGACCMRALAAVWAGLGLLLLGRAFDGCARHWLEPRGGVVFLFNESKGLT